MRKCHPQEDSVGQTAPAGTVPQELASGNLQPLSSSHVGSEGAVEPQLQQTARDVVRYPYVLNMHIPTSIPILTVAPFIGISSSLGSVLVTKHFLAVQTPPIHHGLLRAIPSFLPGNTSTNF